MCFMCAHTAFLFEPGVGGGRVEGPVWMTSLCRQMCWWEEFGISHFLLCIEIFRVRSYRVREQFYQMVDILCHLADHSGAIHFLTNNLRFSSFRSDSVGCDPYT